jgi:hypothetical protein
MSTKDVAPLFLFDDEPPTQDVPAERGAGGEALRLGARGPFGIGLYGSRGRGKTPFIQRARTLAEANARDMHVKTYPIDAWNLEQADLPRARLSQAEPAPRGQASRLELSFAHVTDAGMARLAGQKNLEALVPGCTQVTA